MPHCLIIIVDPCSNRDLYVGRIPGSVTSDQLRTLFLEATSIEYRQGKITRDRVKLGYVMKRSVTHLFLFICFINISFAFLHFDDIQSAAQIMQHTDQYRIDNQSFSISYKILKETTTATNNSQ
jgi:RNA recognition motif-containing protein